MFTKYTIHLIHASVLFGYLTAGLPYYWNNTEKKIVKVTSVLGLLRWYFSVGASFCCTGVAIFTIRSYSNEHGFLLTDDKVVIRVMVLFVTLIANLFHYNVLRNRHDFVSTLNNSLEVYKAFEASVREREEIRRKNWCNEIFSITFIFAISLPQQVAMLTLMRCDIHILNGLISEDWMCTNDVAFSLYGLTFPRVSIKIILLASINLIGVANTCGSAVLIVATWYPYLFYGVEIMSILNKRCLKGINRKDFLNFIKTYRCFQILQGKINLVIGTYFMPGHLLLFSGLFIMSIVGLLKNTLIPLLIFIFVGWTSIYSFHYFLILSLLWKFTESTEELLRNVKYFCVTKSQVKFLKAFRPLKICLGKFCDFDKASYIFFGSFVVGLTINILLMKPNAHNQKIRY